jgi:magnesium-protoporphyrin IX monomethyl ester (oxidative) cyclase
MRVLLIRPPLAFTNPYQLDSLACGLPLGLLYIAAMLEKAGCEVSIFDGLVNFDLDSKQKRFAEKIKQRDRDPVHFGAEWEEITQCIKEKAPDIVGITNHYTEEVDMAFKTAKIAKQADNKILTVLGGPFASTCPEELLEKESGLDMVVMGEGENTCRELVKALLNKEEPDKIQGLAYRSNGKVTVNQRRPYIRDLDSLPFPAYHLVDMERYFYFQRYGYSTRRQTIKSRKIPVITSRGCPFNCTFCCIHLHMGRVWRPHSSEYVLRHIDFLVKNFNAEHILFEDDNINLKPLRFEKILDGLKTRDYKIFWDTPNGVRADKLNETLIRKAKESGCLFLKIGVESGDRRVVNKIVKKHLDLDKVLNAAELCRRLKVKLQAFFIVGFPGETKKEIKRTINFSLRLFKKFNVISAIGPAKPLIGTELRKECREKGYLTEPIETPGMKERLISRQEMIKTKEFDLDYLFRAIKKYELRRRLITIEKIFVFSLRRPQILFREIPQILKGNLREAFNSLRKEFDLV